jgi:hypothetical protein
MKSRERELYEFKIEDFRLQIESEKIDLAVFNLKSAISNLQSL